MGLPIDQATIEASSEILRVVEGETHTQDMVSVERSPSQDSNGSRSGFQNGCRGRQSRQSAVRFMGLPGQDTSQSVSNNANP